MYVVVLAYRCFEVFVDRYVVVLAVAGRFVCSGVLLQYSLF